MGEGLAARGQRTAQHPGLQMPLSPRLGLPAPLLCPFPTGGGTIHLPRSQPPRLRRNSLLCPPCVAAWAPMEPVWGKLQGAGCQFGTVWGHHCGHRGRMQARAEAGASTLEPEGPQGPPELGGTVQALHCGLHLSLDAAHPGRTGC